MSFFGTLVGRRIPIMTNLRSYVYKTQDEGLRTMQSRVWLWMLGWVSVVAASVTGCGKISTGLGTEGTTSSTSVKIKGTFVGGTHSGISALTTQQVSRAAFFYVTGRHSEATLTDGAFSLELTTLAPGGLIFLGSSNQFLGYLSLGSGIDSLPLNRLGSSVTTLDLGILSSSGAVVSAGTSPLGSSLSLSADEQAAIALADDLFSSVVKNPDIDENGTPDFLEGKFFLQMILYFIKGGTFGDGLTPSVSSSATLTGYKLALDAMTSNRPDTVSFTGPSGSGLSTSTSEQKNTYSDRTTYFSPLVSSPVIPPAGRYDVVYENSIFKFAIPDQSLAPSRVVLPIPTVTLNSDGTLQKVQWLYRIPSGPDTSLEPTTLIKAIEIQVDGSGTPCASYPQSGRIYNSGQLPVSTLQHTLTCQTLLWSNVSTLNTAYDDVYGNHNVVSWHRTQ
jgi:hypothetical protein